MYMIKQLTFDSRSDFYIVIGVTLYGHEYPDTENQKNEIPNIQEYKRKSFLVMDFDFHISPRIIFCQYLGIVVYGNNFILTFSDG